MILINMMLWFILCVWGSFVLKYIFLLSIKHKSLSNIDKSRSGYFQLLPLFLPSISLPLKRVIYSWMWRRGNGFVSLPYIKKKKKDFPQFYYRSHQHSAFVCVIRYLSILFGLFCSFSLFHFIIYQDTCYRL